MAVRANRILDRVLRALGADVVALQPSVGADQIALVSVVDQLQFASGARATMRMWVNHLPSTGVGQFSVVEIQPLRGMWVRRLVNSGASQVVVNLTAGGLSALAANDNLGLIPVVLGRADGSDFSQNTSGDALSQLVTPGTAGFPVLASWQVGRQAVQPAGVFTAGGQTWSDLWCPAQSVLRIGSPVGNTAIALNLEIEWPADTVFTP